MLAWGAPLLALALAQSFPPWVERTWRLPVHSADAPACERCHAAEARGQARSIHAAAASPGLLGQLPTEGAHLAPGLACLMCHAPEDVQQPWRSSLTLPPAPATTSPPSRWTAALTDGVPIEPNPAFHAEAEHRGVSCAACHWREGAVLASPDHAPSAAALAVHPVRSEGLLLQPAFCATCHQFGPETAINGKPVENTWHEMQSSFWGKGGATCQGCHVPTGEHRFQGIHTPDLVAASVVVALELAPGSAKGELVLTNEAVGHDFPTYATPRVHLTVEALDAHGQPQGEPTELWIGRDLRFEKNAWREVDDTRIPPGESARLRFDLTRRHPAQLHAHVRVEPDFAYVALYRQLLDQGGLDPVRQAEIETALKRAQTSGYDLFDEVRNVKLR